MTGERPDSAPAARLQMLGDAAPTCEDGVCAVPEGAAPTAADDPHEG